jgi:hypothetical protein
MLSRAKFAALEAQRLLRLHPDTYRCFLADIGRKQIFRL